MDVLVTYDIGTLDRDGERRLVRVASICERFGVRAQYSVFECRLSPAAFQVLMAELGDVIDHGVDSINIYRFDRPIPEVRSTLGHRKSSNLGHAWVFGPGTTGDP